ncbi:hypothetical protein GCM10009799_09250 [Nocardiopsis rhodophaea]|uniref:VWFA domain-containing protein n=1 Tax=Nocardiopsis rhodophaea TaxID=280238 RepID=A0ABP5DWU2_9ACTN
MTPFRRARRHGHHGSGTGRRNIVLVAAAALLLTGNVPAAAAPSALREPDDEGGRSQPLDIVILVDESGSLTDDDVDEEVKAASTIAQSVLNPGSRVTVVGFGSNNGVSGQDAAREVCRPTLVEEGNGGQYLADCVSDLHRRDKEEGNDTDHAEALSRALAYLDDSGAPDDAAKMIFLLTDGALDVPNSPNYGRSAGDRNDNALKVVDRHLETARDSGVQVWPLGFGSSIDRDQLDAFAAGGSQQTCNDMDVATPSARVVDSSAEVVRSLQEALAAASCAGLSPPDSESLPGGRTAELTVDIPVIATEGALTVTKNNPAITVEYVDPQGEVVPSQGDHDGAEFSRSGENSAVEVLRIVDPRPGTWKVRLTSPSGSEEELVTATAQWQGRINTFLTVEGTSRPGEKLAVRLELSTRRGVITDPDALDALDFSATVTEPGGEPRAVELRDNGEAPDLSADDGQFAGRVTAPDDAGTLTFTSTVQGRGVAADVREFPHAVTADGIPLTARISLDPLTEVWEGRTISGTLTVDNQASDDAEVQLVVDSPEGVLTKVDRAARSFSPGQSEEPFTITVGADSAHGPATFSVRAFDSSGATVGSAAPLTVTVRPAPGIIERYWWAWTLMLIGVVALTAAIAVRNARVRARRDVRGLVAELYLGDQRVGPELRAPSRWSDTFKFTVREPEGPGQEPRLDTPDRGAACYIAFRTPPDSVRIRTPHDQTRTVKIGGSGTQLSDGLLLAFRDERRVSASPPPPCPDPTDTRHGNTGTGRDAETDTGVGNFRPHSSEDPWIA